MSYAIIRTGGKQYRVSEGDILDVEKINVEGDSATFTDVLLVSDAAGIRTGSPMVAGATVQATVVEPIRKAKKVIAYKFKRRKGYHRTVGHRRQLTRVKISAIVG